MVEVRRTHTGIRLLDYPGWPGWIFDLDIKWLWDETEEQYQSAVGDLHMTPPPGKRRKNAREPDERAQRRIVEAAAAQNAGGTGILFLDMIAIEFPGFGSTHSRERARVVAMLSYTALSSGLCPRRAVATEIGVPLDAHAGRRVKSTTLDRWLEETRELGYLKPYGPAKHTPRRWPWEGWPEGRPPAR